MNNNNDNLKNIEKILPHLLGLGSMDLQIAEQMEESPDFIKGLYNQTQRSLTPFRLQLSYSCLTRNNEFFIESFGFSFKNLRLPLIDEQRLLTLYKVCPQTKNLNPSDCQLINIAEYLTFVTLPLMTKRMNDDQKIRYVVDNNLGWLIQIQTKQ